MNEVIPYADKENMANDFNAICERAAKAKQELANSSIDVRNLALSKAAELMRQYKGDIQRANDEDMKKGRDSGLTEAMLDRLLLNDFRIDGMADALDNIVTLDDPVGKILTQWDNPANGLNFKRITVPIGIIGIIYESRPNVTADAAALCLKAGNVVVLRGGKESLHSSLAISNIMREALREAKLPDNAVQFISTRNRYMVELMLKASGKIDLLIPRGGKGLTGRVMAEANVPVLAHLDGNCHLYADKTLKLDQAIEVIFNAKMRRTGICGALETLLVHRDVASKLLPPLLAKLRKEECVVRGDQATRAFDERMHIANEQDWWEEYLTKLLAIKIVASLDEAIEHINHYGSHHTDGILTQDDAARDEFLQRVDSAIVMHNCSTQYADGGEFGMGAEIGIATGRIHARGPVATNELVTYKNLVFGNGHCRP